MFKRKSQLRVNDNKIAIKNVNGDDYISLTDMLRSKDGVFFIDSWLRNRNTVEFLGVWESMYNPNFNYVEFDVIKSKAGLNNFKISVKEWVKRTNAIGLRAETGRYGGTYAHKDIAFEFGTWISPTFKLYLIKEYQRLKEIETNQYNLEWDVRRVISKTNYIVHTDAVKEHLAPEILPWRQKYVYTDEADLINLALFGLTAKEWRDKNPNRVKNNENIRDSASINELIILSSLESYNAEMVKGGIGKEQRYEKMTNMVQTQIKSLEKVDPIKSLKKLNDRTYLGVSSE